MIVCNTLALLAVSAQLKRIFTMVSTNITFTVMAIIIFPIVGIVADTRIRRFKAIQASIVFLMVSSLFNIVLVLLQD